MPAAAWCWPAAERFRGVEQRVDGLGFAPERLANAWRASAAGTVPIRPRATRHASRSSRLSSSSRAAIAGTASRRRAIQRDHRAHLLPALGLAEHLPQRLLAAGLPIPSRANRAMYDIRGVGSSLARAGSAARSRSAQLAAGVVLRQVGRTAFDDRDETPFQVGADGLIRPRCGHSLAYGIDSL